MPPRPTRKIHDATASGSAGIAAVPPPPARKVPTAGPECDSWTRVQTLTMADAPQLVRETLRQISPPKPSQLALELPPILDKLATANATLDTDAASQEPSKATEPAVGTIDAMPFMQHS